MDAERAAEPPCQRAAPNWSTCRRPGASYSGHCCSSVCRLQAQAA